MVQEAVMRTLVVRARWERHCSTRYTVEGSEISRVTSRLITKLQRRKRRSARHRKIRRVLKTVDISYKLGCHSHVKQFAPVMSLSTEYKYAQHISYHSQR